MKRRSSYKVTFFDRHGAAGADALKSLGHGLTTFGVSLLMFYLAGYKIGLMPVPLIGFTLVGSITLAAAAMLFGLLGSHGAGAATEFVMVSGAGTPYQEQFSHQQALVMQRDYASALALYEQQIQSTPNEPRVRIAAADLYATHGENPARASELYREVQRIPEIESGHDIYVTNKLADLYLGPLGQPGKALVEFRKLIHRYPGSTAAQHAKRAIDHLKPDLVKSPHDQSESAS